MAKKGVQIQNWLFPITLFIFFILFFIFLKNFFVDYLWYESLGYLNRFLKVARIKIFVFFSFFVFSFLLLLTNNLFLRLNTKKRLKKLKGYFSIFQSMTTLLIIAFIYSIVPTQWWDVIITFLNSVKFNLKDPLFHQDISFYVFQLSLYQSLRLWFLFFLIFLLLWDILYYYLAGFISFEKYYFSLPIKIRRHLGFLIFLILMNIGIGFYLNRFNLLYTQNFIIKGASFLEVHGSLPFYYIFSFLFLLLGLYSLYWMNKPKNSHFPYIIGFFLVLIFLRSIYPFLLQQFIVAPNEIEKQKPYIKNTIKFTRIAYQLNKVKKINYPIYNDCNLSMLSNEKDSINNVKIWESQRVKTILNQVQNFRPYYIFPNVDTDRYFFNNKINNILLAPREISRNNLPPQSRNWINNYLRYTHGYGIIMLYAGLRDNNFLPEFIIKNIPLSSSQNLMVTRPEIYFGESIKDYAIVNTKIRELQYPNPGLNSYTYYRGKGGIRLNSLWKKILMAVHFSDFKIVFSKLITKKSRIMIKRNIIQMVKTIVPFLLIDNDPYLTVVNGQLYWFIDAYTFTDKFPYAEKYNDNINYICNSVKIIINAYTGKINFYIVDKHDPIIRAYKKSFPGLFRSDNKLSLSFKNHFRYPSDLFIMQAEILKNYHNENYEAFYNRDDFWDIPVQESEDGVDFIQNEYIVNKIPLHTKPAFFNSIPFKSDKQNSLTAILLGGCDPEYYGNLFLYTFTEIQPDQDLMLISSMINEHPMVFKLLSLWQSENGTIMRSPIITIPINHNIFYVQSLFLYHPEKKIPELRKIIVVYKKRVAIADNLHDAFSQVVSGKIKYDLDFNNAMQIKMLKLLDKIDEKTEDKSYIREMKKLIMEIK